MDINNCLDFSLRKYELLCQQIANSLYTNVTFEEYLNVKDPEQENYIIIRHDVDRKIKYALDMAKLEHKYNIRSTYYFRIAEKVYIPEIITKICDLGHEIGYHYETVDKCNGNLNEAINLFDSELQAMRKVFSVRTVCMHGNPLSPNDNKEIWNTVKLSDFNLLGEPYLSLDYSRFAYFSDSGRTWAQDYNKKVKDRVDSYYHYPAKVTDDVINIIGKGEPENICLLIHPERWPKDLINYISRYFIDISYNAGKKLLMNNNFRV